MPVTLVVNTNSYIDLTEAEMYFSERLYSDAWTGASDEQKVQALIMATRRIDALAFKGKKLNTDQVLAFPRYIYKPCNCPECYEYSETLPSYIEIKITDRLKYAVCEEALALLKGIPKRVTLQHQGVKEAEVGNITEIYTGARTKLLSPEARELLRPYMIGSVRIT